MSATTVGQTTAQRSRPSILRRIHQRLGLLGMIAAAWLIIVVLAAIFAPLVAPYAPNAENLLASYAGPSSSHLLGTDQLGRDLLSRLIWGARSSLLGPLIVVAFAVGFVPHWPLPQRGAVAASISRSDDCLICCSPFRD